MAVDPLTKVAQELAWQLTVCAALNEADPDPRGSAEAAMEGIMGTIPNPWTALAGSVSISVRLLEALAETWGMTMPALTAELGRLMALMSGSTDRQVKDQEPHIHRQRGAH